jgi:SAM-dependent methyltransferase
VSEWERHSAWWVAGFTAGADVEYAEQIVPLIEAGVAGASRVLDVGCGEGQLARTAVAGGAQAVGIDGAWNQLAVARDRGGGPSYARSLATDLPFPEAAFDAAIACLVFEHLDDLTAAASEIGRVLETGGRLHCVLNHPLTQTPGSGLVEDLGVDPPERYWRVGPYLVETDGVERVDQDVELRFVHRPLFRYVNAFADAGLVVERMLEPWPPGDVADSASETPADASFAAAVPRLLYLRLRREERVSSLRPDG